MDHSDPATAGSLDELAACLRYVHLRADKPTYRALEQQTKHASEFLPGTRLRRVRLTRSILSDVLLGRKFPGKAFMLTFVDACGVDLENYRRWEQAWDRLAVQYQQSSPTPGEAEQLRQENEELRQQIAAQKSAAGAVPTDKSVLPWRDHRPQSSITELPERYPEGFDPKTRTWIEGRKQERKKQYAAARRRVNAHRMWDELLQHMSAGGHRSGSGASPAMLGEVLSRVALAGEPVPRSEISKGSMLVHPAPLASGTVGKAVDALIGEGLLAEDSMKERPVRSSVHAAPVRRQVGYRRDSH